MHCKLDIYILYIYTCEYIRVELCNFEWNIKRNGWTFLCRLVRYIGFLDSFLFDLILQTSLVNGCVDKYDKKVSHKLLVAFCHRATATCVFERIMWSDLKTKPCHYPYPAKNVTILWTEHFSLIHLQCQARLIALCLHSFSSKLKEF